jgi:hypothetical protein
MIKISDPLNLLPEIYENFDSFQLSAQSPDIEILHAQWPRPTPSKVPTIFVNREPDSHSASSIYQTQIIARPSHLFAITAWSDRTPFPLPWFKFLSTMLITGRVNKGIPAVTVEQKPFSATALWGGHMHNRSIMFDRLLKLGLLDKCLINLHPRLQENFLFGPTYQSSAIQELDDERFLKHAYTNGKIYTMVSINNEPRHWLSQIIPYRLYNSAYIDLVSETEQVSDPTTFVMTEKICKPLLLGQIFLVYGCRHFLRHLRDIGFRTYSQWLDESYDDIVDSNKRCCAIIDSFSQFDAKTHDEKIKILADAQEVSLHNRQLATNNAWLLDPFVKHIRNLVQ